MSADRASLAVGGITVRLSSPGKVLFPGGGITKRDLAGFALRLRELLEGELGLTTFVKTTGGKGLHVHVPLQARVDADSVRGLARQAADVLAARDPGRVTTGQRREGRGGRVYLDLCATRTRRRWSRRTRCGTGPARRSPPR
jgi:DNA primase